MMKRILFLVISIILSSFLISAQESNPSTSNNLKRGIYKDYNEFFNNNPSILDSFILDSVERTNNMWKGTYSYIPRLYDTNMKINRIWGFCDGKRAFIAFQIDCYPIEIKEGQYLFTGHGYLNNKKAFYNGFQYGIIGGSIMTAVEMGNSRNSKVDYIIDEITGDAIIPGISEFSNLDQKGVNIIIYRRKGKEAKEAVEFIINDSLKYSFIPNSYASINVYNKPSPVKVCYGEDFKECLMIEHNNVIDKYIECTQLKNEELPRMYEVEAYYGNFKSSKPKIAQENRDYSK